jgi:1,4-dihydroxy-2-naphthoate octaprenyltransferase
MAYSDTAHYLPAAALAMLGAFLIQIGTNFWNDYADFKSGADNERRRGPQRATQAGLVSPRAMLQATLLVFFMAAVVVVLLTRRAGWPIVIVGICSILSGILYTGGPRPLGYMGLGDLFVLIFFGPVAVGGTYYVQALDITPIVLFAGLGPGLLAVAILAINNLRDIDTDREAGKRTLAVILGPTFARREYVFCILGAVAIPVILFYIQAGEHPYCLLAVLTLPLGRFGIIQVCGSDSPDVLNPMLGKTAKLLLLYSILFSLGWVL